MEREKKKKKKGGGGWMDGWMEQTAEPDRTLSTASNFGASVAIGRHRRGNSSVTVKTTS